MSILTPAPVGIAPWLMDVQAIYHEPAVLNHARGREILDRFPEAKRVIVESHWKIAGLHGSEGNVEDWIAIKRNVLVLGVKSSLSARPNTRRLSNPLLLPTELPIASVRVDAAVSSTAIPVGTMASFPDSAQD